MYTLYRETIVQTSIDKAWDFIRNPTNLNKITPDDMAFEIVSDLPEEMYDGLMVQYSVKIPFIGTQPWLSEIKYVVHQHSFVDEQKIGPYKFWHHYHAIERVKDGVKFIDKVTYEVPYSFLGRLAHALFIRKTLERIFAYRNEQFTRLLTE
jgi:ligand-binding SRPBCC domain-containing protein